MKATKFILPLFISGTILTSCGEAEKTEEHTEETSPTTEEPTTEVADPNEETEFKMDLLISNNITGPSEMIADIHNNGMGEFIEGLTMEIDPSKGFSGTNMTKGLKFGALGTDLTYLGIHDRPDLALKHVAAINKLSKDLDCGMELTDDGMEKFEAAKEDSKAISDLMFEEYTKIDGYLRDNDRIETAAHILTGAVVESLYLVTAQLKDKELNEEDREILYSQKQSINELIDIYSDLGESEGNATLIEELNLLKGDFDIESGDISTETLTNIYEHAKALRDEIDSESIL